MNSLKTFGIVAAIGGLLVFLKRKKAALQNIQITKIDVAIDLNKTQANFYLKLFYNLKIALYNSANVAVNIKGIQAKFYINGIEFAEVNKVSNTIIEAKKTSEINIASSVQTLGVIQSILDIISEGKAKIKVEGSLITDLGIIEFSKEHIV